MRLTITNHAQKQIKKLPKPVQIIFFNKINNLRNSNFSNLIKLSGKGNFYKSRIGDYRIIFLKLTNEIEIVLVGHRKEVYNFLSRMHT